MLKEVLFREGIPTMERGLDAAALRQKVIADNLANVATPGYQARHVTFEALMKGRQAPHRLGLSTTAPGHMEGPGGSAVPLPRVEVDTSPQLRSGINNVDVERELAGIQKNSLVHSALSQLMAGKYRMIRQAIVDR